MFYYVIMGRFVAIDYGLKRVGLAVSDEMQLIATKLTTVEEKDIFPFLQSYVSKENIELFVVGLPKQMNNQPSESAPYVKTFVKKLQVYFASIPIYMIDERYTSKLASQTIAHSGLKKKKRQEKSLIDTIAAVVILQDFMTMYKNGKSLQRI